MRLRAPDTSTAPPIAAVEAHEPLGPALDGLGAAAGLTRTGLSRSIVVVTGVEDPGLGDRRAQQALVDRKLVERAKGLLMSALPLSERMRSARSGSLRVSATCGWSRWPSASSSSRACSSR